MKSCAACMARQERTNLSPCMTECLAWKERPQLAPNGWLCRCAMSCRKGMTNVLWHFAGVGNACGRSKDIEKEPAISVVPCQEKQCLRGSTPCLILACLDFMPRGVLSLEDGNQWRDASCLSESVLYRIAACLAFGQGLQCMQSPELP